MVILPSLLFFLCIANNVRAWSIFNSTEVNVVVTNTTVEAPTVIETTTKIVTTAETTTITTTTAATITIENTTVTAPMSASCNRTKLLFSNLVESLESKRSINRFYHDVDLFIGHLDNLTLNYTDKRQQAWMGMVRKLVCLLNRTVTENEPYVPPEMNVTTTETLYQTFPMVESAILPSSTVSSITSVIPSSTVVPGFIETETDPSVDAIQYNAMLKLIKYEYFRNLKDEEKTDQNDDHSDDEDNGHMAYYYKSVSSTGHNNDNSQLFY